MEINQTCFPINQQLEATKQLVIEFRPMGVFNIRQMRCWIQIFGGSAVPLLDMVGPRYMYTI